MANFVVIAQTESPIAQKIASMLSAPVNTFSLDWFADTEPSVVLEQSISIVNKTALVVFQCDLRNNRSINDYVAGFVLLVGMIKQAGASSVIAVLPYLPYARQEKNILATILKAIGVDRIITCDIHSRASELCFGKMLNGVSSTDFWVEKIKSFCLSDICVVSPDHGGIDRAVAIANALGCPYAFIDKKRSAKDASVALCLHGRVEGRVAVVVDDIIGTGHTAVNACQMLQAHGARSVIGCFTHAVLCPGACERLAIAGFEKILITDTLPAAIKKSGANIQVCSIDDYLAEHVYRQIGTS